MPKKSRVGLHLTNFKTELREHDHDLKHLRGWIFQGLLLHAIVPDYDGADDTLASEPGINSTQVKLRMRQACFTARFAGATITDDLADEDITHVVVTANRRRMKTLRQRISQ